jgi:hypothetical protein
VNPLAQIAGPHAWASMLSSGWGDLDRTEFWLAVAKIIWINILLSGGNAVVIALACRIGSGFGA